MQTSFRCGERNDEIYSARREAEDNGEGQKDRLPFQHTKGIPESRVSPPPDPPRNRSRLSKRKARDACERLFGCTQGNVERGENLLLLKGLLTGATPNIQV